MNHLYVRLYECNACGARYPIMPYYPVAAPHGPDRKCRGDLGWTPVRESVAAAAEEEERGATEEQ